MVLNSSSKLRSHVVRLLIALAVLNAPSLRGDEVEYRVVSVQELAWSPLNPARGAMSPQAGTLWGDRNAAVPTGFLVKFVDGFSSPPHIHNVTYRAVVISGLIHNDDPDAAKMWMPAGSFWTQPQGEVHITAASADNNIALVEIDHGPYRVLPVEEAFDNGERPLNVDAGNIVWLDDPSEPSRAQRAYLWGEPATGRSNGTFLKLARGYQGILLSEGDSLHAVVISGALEYGAGRAQRLDPGSYFGSARKGATHPLAAVLADVILYIRSDGPYKLQ